MYVYTVKLVCDKCDHEIKEKDVWLKAKHDRTNQEYHLCKECTGAFHRWLSEC